MTKRILDHDPLSHTTTYHEYDPIENKTIITEIQDIEPYLAMAHEMRKDDGYTQHGIKEGVWHYAKIPNSIANRMLLEDGVNVFERGQEKEVLKLINTKYSQCKMTRKRHS